MTKWKLPVITAIAGLVAGILLEQSRHQDKVTETYAPAVVTSNGSVVAERVPDAPVPQPIKQAAKEVKGELVRAGSVTVETTKPVVQLDWGLIKQDDGNRIVFHTDDGTIIDAIDIPIETLQIEVHPKWSLGIAVPLDNPKGVGPAVTRHFGRFSVGAAAFKPYGEKWTAIATASISW